MSNYLIAEDMIRETLKKHSKKIDENQVKRLAYGIDGSIQKECIEQCKKRMIDANLLDAV
jgi:pentose-5-phosphate-3-epimerase